MFVLKVFQTSYRMERRLMTSETVKWLIDHGIRVSLQRIAVMSYLLESRLHPTVEMIYAGLHAMFPTLSRSTIYQSLELFCEKGAAMKVAIDDGEMRFEANLSKHGHFKCLKCGTLMDFNYPDEPPLPAPSGNFRVLQQHLFCRGICPPCLAV